jgi:hypothetical protein
LLKRLEPLIEIFVQGVNSQVNYMERSGIYLASAGLVIGIWLASAARAQGQDLAIPAGVEKICTIRFDKDTKRPARVEDSALSCLNDAAKRLKENPSVKLVLVASSDPVADHAALRNGDMRDVEDTTGYDVRYEDIAMYRSVNTKGYLTRWYGIDAARILPTTDEYHHNREVSFYLVPGTADFKHNYLDTTKTNEKPCTVKPCYDPGEESLRAQPRTRIPSAK